jgi:hypothetical protein
MKTESGAKRDNHFKQNFINKLSNNMKTLKVIAGFVCLLWIQNNCVELSAQSGLDSLKREYQQNGLIKKIINHGFCNDSVSGTSIRFVLEDKRLVDEFLEVFKKERNNASSIIQKKEGSELLSETCFFDGEDADASVSYACLLKNGGTGAEITYIKSGRISSKKNHADNRTAQPKYMIPKGAYMHVNGEKLNAEEARMRGLNVEEF